MALLSAFRTDSTKVKQGDWVSPGEEYDDLMILTRGYTDDYVDARAARLRRAALLNSAGDVNKIPNAISRAIVIELMIEYLVLDVRGLSDRKEDGTLVPINLEGFRDILRNPDYGDLVSACQKAAAKVGLTKTEDLKDAVKN